MIVAVVRIPLPEGLKIEQAMEGFKKVAPNFREVPGLIRKHFLFSEEGYGGGVYVWESRDAAEKLYAEGGAWRENIRKTFNAEPEITFYQSPVTVDNEKGDIDIAA